MKAIKLNSDNFENTLVTPDAYEEIKMQMSTGDFHTHSAVAVNVPEGAEVISKADLYGGELPEDLQECFADHVQVLKQKRSKDGLLGVALVMQVSVGYFKNGRANMHTVREYSVYLLQGMNGFDCQGTYRTKADALKAFKAEVNQYHWSK